MQKRSIHDFPPQLREIPEVPEHLWLRGSLPSTNHKLLTVVGSRNISDYGHRACNLLIAGLSRHPISIVSGLALGADAAAHEAALAAGLHTIAFPGSGLDDRVLAPRTNLSLAERILAAGGALVSEYEPLKAAEPWTFPRRNRLMVGIADAVLVIEAGEHSGTLITARLAGEYNRELLVVPHEIDAPHGHGAETFLRIGATPVFRSEHILEALGLS